MAEPIERFWTIADLVAGLGAGPGAVTALYPSAGHDTKPFTFLGPAFLVHRGVDMPAPEVYVYVDHTEPRDEKAAGLFFHDDRTRIRSTDVREATLRSYPVRLMRVVVKADEGEREIAVARIRVPNELAYGLCRDQGWSPDVFIGVLDGERFGGQVPPGWCENSLRLYGSAMTAFARPPRWWVADHFRPAVHHLAEGDVVRSPDPEFPVEFRKVRLLSSDWGHTTQLFGATVFEVLPLPQRRQHRVYMRQRPGEDNEEFVKRFTDALFPEGFPGEGGP
jgi:hypothetical protein